MIFMRLTTATLTHIHRWSSNNSLPNVSNPFTDSNNRSVQTIPRSYIYCIHVLPILFIVTGLASRGADAQGVGAHLSLTPYPNTTFQINDEVKLDCVVVNGNNAVDYQIQWYINNSLVQTSNNNSGSSTDGAAGVSITNNNGASQLSLQGALKYDLTSVTCNATGISQTLTTLLILERGQYILYT